MPRHRLHFKALTIALQRAPTVELADALIQRLRFSEVGSYFFRYMKRAGFIKELDHSEFRKFGTISLLPNTDAMLFFCLPQAGAFTIKPGTAVGLLGHALFNKI